MLDLKKLFFLTLALISPLQSIAEDYVLIRVGDLSQGDYHEPEAHLPADYEELCLKPNTRHEVYVTSENLANFVYTQNPHQPVSRHHAWESAGSREALNTVTGTPYNLTTLHFVTPRATDGGCIPTLLVISVDAESDEYYGIYTVKMHKD